MMMMMMTLVLNQWANIAEANRKRPRKSQEKKDRKRKKNAHGNQIHLANSILAGERALCCWFCRWLSTQQQQASNKQPKKTHTTNMSQRQGKKSILTTNENERKKIVAHNWRVHHHNVDRGEKGIQCYMVWPKIDSLLYYLPVNLIAKCSINVFIQFFSLLLYCFPSLSLLLDAIDSISIGFRRPRERALDEYSLYLLLLAFGFSLCSFLHF